VLFGCGIAPGVVGHPAGHFGQGSGGGERCAIVRTVVRAAYDCSGLVMMAYQAAGISLPRITYQQVDVGTPVYSDSQLEPGDLLFTPGSDGTAENPGHVGMYIGSGLVIQAPQTGEDIKITPFSGYWQESTVAIRRIV
jgi:cell wall-associated NlpC family hydrolase